MAPCSRHFERRPNESHVCGWILEREGGPGCAVSRWSLSACMCTYIVKGIVSF